MEDEDDSGSVFELHGHLDDAPACIACNWQRLQTLRSEVDGLAADEMTARVKEQLGTGGYEEPCTHYAECAIRDNGNGTWTPMIRMGGQISAGSGLPLTREQAAARAIERALDLTQRVQQQLVRIVGVAVKAGADPRNIQVLALPREDRGEDETSSAETLH